MLDCTSVQQTNLHWYLLLLGNSLDTAQESRINPLEDFAVAEDLVTIGKVSA